MDEAFFQRRRLEWDAERAEALELIRRLDRADRGNLDLGVQVLELADEAYDLYSRQEPHEQRVLLDLLCSNCEIGGGKFKVEPRKPFCYLRNPVQEARDDKAPSEGSEGARPAWWALLDEVRTWAVGLEGWNEADSGRVRMLLSGNENIDCSL